MLLVFLLGKLNTTNGSQYFCFTGQLGTNTVELSSTAYLLIQLSKIVLCINPLIKNPTNGRSIFHGNPREAFAMADASFAGLTYSAV